MLPCFDSPTSVKPRPAPSASPLAAAVHAGLHHVRLVRWTLGVMGAMAPGLTFGLLAVSFAGGLTTLALFNIKSLLTLMEVKAVTDIRVLL